MRQFFMYPEKTSVAAVGLVLNLVVTSLTNLPIDVLFEWLESTTSAFKVNELSGRNVDVSPFLKFGEKSGTLWETSSSSDKV